MKLLISSIVFLFCYSIGSAQDIAFARPGNGAAYLNPALTSLQGTSDISFAHRNQWPALSESFRTNYLGSSHYLHQVNGVVGFNWLNDKSVEGTFTMNRFSLNYGQLFNIGNKGVVIKPAVELSYYQTEIDASRIPFSGTFVPRPGIVISPNSPNYSTSADGIDVSAGFITYYNNAMVGVALAHIGEPQQELFGTVLETPRRLSAHASYYIPLNRKQNVALQPYVIYHQQEHFHFLQQGLSFYFRAFNVSVGMRNRDSFVASVGYDKGRFSFNYVYDQVSSKLTVQATGSHEIGIALRMFKDKPRHPKSRGMLAPLF